MDDLFQQLWTKFLRIGECVLDALEKGVDYQELQGKVREELDGLGREIMRSVIEAADERLRLNRSERRGWVVEQRNHVKELLTPFGPLRYARTYFKHSASQSYAYLADQMMGITPHQRIDAGLMGELVERATEQSFRRSGEWSEEKSWRVSGQTVMKASRRIEMTDCRPVPASRALRRLPYVFIQADEDHVPNQKGPRWQPRLVTVHEGTDGPPERRRLVDPMRFGGLYLRGEAEQLYEEVWKYLDATYDLERVEAILVSGDGASWIRGLCEYLPGAEFVLDRFHARKYVLAATGSDGDLYRELWQALHEADRGQMRSVMAKAKERAETAAQKERVMESLRYFESRWDGVTAWKRYEGIWPGCSAEGDVSHVYAARMSSRPMAWGREGVDQMSRLRVMCCNGGSVKEAYLKQHSQTMTPVRVARTYISEARRQIQSHRNIATMLRGNMPVMNSSHRALRRMLRRVIDKNRLFPTR